MSGQHDGLGDGVELYGSIDRNDVLAPDALRFVAALDREFRGERRRLLEMRVQRQRAWAEGEMLGTRPDTKHIRDGVWRVPPPPPDLRDRRVEITGPVDRKMMTKALGSGARVFMADLEDSTSPTWANLIEGQRNLMSATRGTLSYRDGLNRTIGLDGPAATLTVRPRGLHLEEKHVSVDDWPVSASLFDTGMYLFHNYRALLDAGTGPYLYLPKIQTAEEADLWNQVFCAAEDWLGIGRGQIRVTVLIETLPAAFEMDEILWALRDHVCGLNAGRWDYLFSLIKCFAHDPGLVLPDRSALTMTTPFMQAYAKRVVSSAHRHGAYAIGGMSAFIPRRGNPKANEAAFANVREDKSREAAQGFDGTWVAHPDLIPIALESFDARLGRNQNQIEPLQPRGNGITDQQLLDFRELPVQPTAGGLQSNVRVALRYLRSWLSGVGAVAIDNLMEDAATAEIARAQIWQWVHRGASLSDGTVVTEEMCGALIRSETETLVAEDELLGSLTREASSLLRQTALSEEFVEFFTLPAYGRLCELTDAPEEQHAS